MELKENYRWSAGLFCAGALAGFALPPYFILPVIFISFSLLFLRIENVSSLRTIFYSGWWFGVGYFLLSFGWVGNSFPIWLKIIAIVLMPTIASIYIGIACVLTGLIKANIIRKTIFFACCWTLLEIARGYSTAFPWALIGQSWLVSEQIVQLASLVGVYGLSFITVVVATLPVIFIDYKTKKMRYTVSGGIYFSIVISLLAISFIWGQAKITNPDYGTGRSINVRVIQPNINHSYEWDMRTHYPIFHKHATLSKLPYKTKPDIIIWPEGALYYTLFERAGMKEKLAEAIPDGSFLVSGYMRDAVEEGEHKVYNSVVVYNSDGESITSYDKHKLVPFGEFVPFPSILFFVDETLTNRNGDYSKGVGPKTISIKGLLSFSPLVCYESTFTNQVIDTNSPPDLLINISNDGWFNGTTGPARHFNIARLRSIEENLPLVSAANSGISSIIDPNGKILQKSNTMEEAVIDASVFIADNHKKTIYSKTRMLVPILLILFVIFEMYGVVRRK